MQYLRHTYTKKKKTLFDVYLKFKFSCILFGNSIPLEDFTGVIWVKGLQTVNALKVQAGRYSGKMVDGNFGNQKGLLS